MPKASFHYPRSWAPQLVAPPLVPEAHAASVAAFVSVIRTLSDEINAPGVS